MEQSQESTTTPRRSGKLITVSIAVVAFLLGIGLYALLGATILKPSTSNNSDKKEQTVSDKSTVLSYETYKDLIHRTNIIAFYENTSDQLIIGSWPSFQRLEEIANPSADDKASFAYMYSGLEMPSWQEGEPSTAEENVAVHEALGHTDYSSEPGSYSVHHNFDISEIQKAYKKLFGTEMDTSAKAITIRGAIYDCQVYLPSTKDLYEGLCGGATALLENYSYINNVTLDGDKAYVYFNFINSEYGHGHYMDNVKRTEDLVCYDNFDHKRVTDCEKYFGIGINDKNYQNLQNYRLVFEKDTDGNYIYKTAEKI